MADKKQYIPIGSGNVYYTEFTGSVPENTVIETASNLLGHVEGGAEISYKPTSKTFKDDFGVVSVTKITAEEATFKTSFIAWSPKDFEVFANTARVSEETKEGKTHRTVKIGGTNNDNGKVWLIRFVHKDVVNGDLRITMVGKSSAEVKLAFKPDASSNMDFELTGQAIDSEGTLIYYDEEVVGGATA